MMKNITTAVVCVLGIGFIVGAFQISQSHADKLGKSLTNIGLSAIERGYKCHEDGLTLARCQQIQKDRWDAVASGTKLTDLPAFEK